MEAIAKAVYKGKKRVEGYEKTIGKKVQQVDEHYNIIVDEVSDGRVNQQTLWAKADNKELINKLEGLAMYQQVDFIVNVNFYEGKPSKIAVINLLNETETQTVESIFKQQEQQQEKSEKEVQE